MNLGHKHGERFLTSLKKQSHDITCFKSEFRTQIKGRVFFNRGGRIWAQIRPNIFPCRTINLGAIETSKVCIRYRIYSIF